MLRTIRCICAILLGVLLLCYTVACVGSNEPADTFIDNTTAVTEQADTETITQKEIQASETVTEPPVASFEVTEENGTASVKTPSGLSYNITGYTTIDKETAESAFCQNLTYTFPKDMAKEEFNRFTITYKADRPMKVYVRCDASEEVLYFIEAGEGNFSALLTDFLSNQHCREFTSICIESCVSDNETEASFALVDLTLEAIEVPGDTTYYLENDTLKLGIALHWGGAINYFENKTCKIDGLTNLVNCHDTGRLIQQSYYGTIGENNSYEPEASFGSLWHYNPVQGGDQYGNGGRLIDFQVTDNSVYIKSQPCDWAKRGSFTPFYTENTYTIEEDYIHVDNRAVDFSGWEHPYHGQEIPSVYVTSYLNVFVCYDGDKPWTGDELTITRNARFWDHGGQLAYFPENSTETWFAWISEEDDFGLGVYVPGLDAVGGGRNEPEVRDKDAAGGSTSFGGAWNVIRLKTFEPVTYSYLLTAGSLSEIRGLFTEHKNFVENTDLQRDTLPQEKPYIPEDIDGLINPDLSKAANGGIITTHNCTMEYDTTEEALKLTTTSDDCLITLRYDNAPLVLNAEDYTTLKIVYMIPTTNRCNAYNAELYPCAGDKKAPASDNLMWISGLIMDGKYHTLTIDLKKSHTWRGQVNQIRFDHFNHSESGDIMYIKSIILE